MSSSFQPSHPDEIHTPVWDHASQRPIVDGKYNDPKTGETCFAKGDEYSAPPRRRHYCNQHARGLRGQQVIKKRNLKLDSVIATAYAIRVVLEHELGKEEFFEVVDLMANGIWAEVDPV
ncbi:hypothetical protein BJX99DRAFT_257642 [Aspergillus californicus]